MSAHSRFAGLIAVTILLGAVTYTGVSEAGIGDSLAGSLLIYDAFGTTFRKVKVKCDPACPLCGAQIGWDRDQCRQAWQGWLGCTHRVPKQACV